MELRGRKVAITLVSSYRHPTTADKPQYVKQLFDQIADQYDALNQVISAGHWDQWLRVFQAATGFQPGYRILDVACGTGDLTLMAAEQVGASGRVVGIDLSDGMLRVARRRVSQTPYSGIITLQWGDAMALPFPENSFDGVTMGWAMRNMQSIPQVLTEIYRVLKPGGRFLCLDAARPGNALIRAGFFLYWRTLLPAIDRFYLQSRHDATVRPYTYLSKSLDDYPAPSELEANFRKVGYMNTRHKLLMLGSVAIHSGTK